MIRLNGVDVNSQINTLTAEDSTMPHGAYHLADNPALYQPQLNNNFEFVVTDLDNLISVGTTDVIPNAQEYLRLAVSAATIPHFTQQVVTIPRGNSTIKAAGKPEFGDEPIVINDYIGANTKDILMSWQNLSYNVETEKVGLMSDYKKDCYLIEYTPDWQKVRQWILKGCWIQGLSEGGYSSDGSDKVQISATIQYDYAKIDKSELL